jgi:predicted amidohydrolase
MLRYTVGVIQLAVQVNRVEANVVRAGELVAEAAARGARLVVLPEAFSNGLDLPRARELAQPVPGPLSRYLGELSHAHGVYLAAGLLERDGGAIYSSAVLFDDSGAMVSLYRRTLVYHLERYFLTPGEGPSVVDTPLGRLGLILGYDIQFPEVTRPLFLHGVELLICPALLLKPFAPAVRAMALARAAENSCCLAFASASGENTLAGLTFLGRSAILQSPIGLRPFCDQFRKQPPVLAEAEDGEALLCADVDLQQVRRLQSINPLLNDLRSHPRAAALCGPWAGTQPEVSPR